MIDRMIGELLDVTQASASGGLHVAMRALRRTGLGATSSKTCARFTATASSCMRHRGRRRMPMASRLKQALHNLLENAIKYGRDGHPSRCEWTWAKAGCASPATTQGEPSRRKSFQTFLAIQRAPAAISGGKRGWGLGLMLVESIAEAHGGGVEVESSHELGTTFTIDVLRDARQFRKRA